MVGHTRVGSLDFESDETLYICRDPGAMENLSMGPQVTEELVSACKKIVAEFGAELAVGVAEGEGAYGYGASCPEFNPGAPTPP
eukprot:SAG31_NODE_5462_length_2523_cov_2.836634_4_plen_84_part_00